MGIGEKLIEFKNGSKIIKLSYGDVVRSSRSKCFTVGRARLKDLWKDFWLWFKNKFQ
jgi:hypothetical protein